MATTALSSTSKGCPPTFAVKPVTARTGKPVTNTARSSQWMPSQMRWLGPGFLGWPTLAVIGSGQASVIGDQVNFHAVNFADLPCMDDPLSFDHYRIDTIAESQQELAAACLGFAVQPFEILHVNAAGLLRQHMAAAIESRVDRRRGCRRLHADQRQIRLLFA